MAATTTPASDSPRTTATATNGLPSPWAQVVKGGATTGDSTENNESTSSPNIPANDGNVAKKTAWNTAISPPLPQPVYSQPPGDRQAGVMGAASWPALSDSARLPLKSSVSPSLDSPKSSPDVSAPLSQGPVTSHLQQPKQGSANASQNSSVNSAPPTRQRSMKRGGGGGGGNRQGGFARGPPPPPLPVPEMAHSTFSKIDSTSREIRPSGGFASQSNPSNEHPHHRNSNRRGNFGQHGRGDVRNSYHGGRRDQDHGNSDWSSSNSHGRGAHGHHHRPHGRGFMGPPVQVAPPFAPPLPVRPYGNGYVYSGDGLLYYIPPLPSDSFRNGPYFTGPPPPPYLLPPDPLRVSVIEQINYYFSDANLVKDEFLRSKMDEQGWVPITLIASFPRVQHLSESVPFILDCLTASAVVEVQRDKIRRRGDWMRWIAHQPSTSNPASGSQSPVGSNDNLNTAIEELSLEENQDQDHASAVLKETDEKEMTHNFANLEGSVQRVC